MSHRITVYLRISHFISMSCCFALYTSLCIRSSPCRSMHVTSDRAAYLKSFNYPPVPPTRLRPPLLQVAWAVLGGLALLLIAGAKAVSIAGATAVRFTKLSVAVEGLVRCKPSCPPPTPPHPCIHPPRPRQPLHLAPLHLAPRQPLHLAPRQPLHLVPLHLAPRAFCAEK
jgi:hypothetical protein